jgi:hypothetical protein
VKRICRHSLLALPLLCASLASAQSTIDVGVGFGSNHAKSSNASIDTFGDGILYKTSSLGGFFTNFGANIMLYPHFGVGGQVAVQPAKSDYAGLQLRNTFYDINAIYAPVNTKKAMVQLIGGLGAANMRFYYNSQFCNAFSGCTNQNQFLDSDNHFALHTGAAVQIYVTEHVFIRPQFDVRWVKNNFQYGTNWVTGGTIWVGYSMGDR